MKWEPPNAEEAMKWKRSFSGGEPCRLSVSKSSIFIQSNNRHSHSCLPLCFPFHLANSRIMLLPFYDVNPRLAAQMVPNSYVNKLVQEIYQMFIGAIYHRSSPSTTDPKPAYCNHPFTLWISQSDWAWDWAFECARCMATIEYPKRFPEKIDERRVKGLPPYHAFWYRILQLQKPLNFPLHTKDETPLCPLPKLAPMRTGRTHEERAIEFRCYHIETKNKNMWQFLWEPRTRRPHWMPPPNGLQKEIVKRTWKRLGKGGVHCNLI